MTATAKKSTLQGAEIIQITARSCVDELRQRVAFSTKDVLGVAKRIIKKDKKALEELAKR